MAKFKLDIPIDIDYDLIAIVSSLRNYRLAFLVNKGPGLDFARSDDLPLDLPRQKRIAYFPRFYYYEPLDKTHYYLVNNFAASSSSRMIPELRQVDFLLLLKGNRTEAVMQNIVAGVSKITNVQTCFEVKVDQLYSKHNLIFDDETV
jgi:hypothetical protein